MKKTLNKEIESSIQSHGKAGRDAWNKGDLEQAEKEFMACWQAIPEPRLDYDYAQILSGGMVKFFRNTNQLDKAKHWLQVMRKAYGPGTDLDVEFYAATVHYEAGELDKAYDLFRPQYEAYGKRPFEGEDKKYLEFVKQYAKR